MFKEYAGRNYIRGLWKLVAGVLFVSCSSMITGHGIHSSTSNRSPPQPSSQTTTATTAPPEPPQTAKAPNLLPPLYLLNPKIMKNLRKGEKIAFENIEWGKETGILQIIHAISRQLGLSPAGVATIADIESSLGKHLKSGTTSATGLMQIIESTAITWFACYGKKCIDVISHFDQTAAKEIAFLSQFVGWKEGKAVLGKEKYLRLCGKKSIISLEKRIQNLRYNHVVCIAFSCAHLAEEHSKMISLLKPRLKDFFDKDHLSLLGFDIDKKDLANMDGYNFLFWMKHLWNPNVLVKMLKANPDTRMVDILARQGTSRKKRAYAIRTLKVNDIPPKATVKEVMQLMMLRFESKQRIYAGYFASYFNNSMILPKLSKQIAISTPKP